MRVAGPFTVESLSPHRVLTVDENDELVDGVAEARARYGRGQDFADIILENLRTAGVQQAHKTDRIAFTSLTPWPGRLPVLKAYATPASIRGHRRAHLCGPAERPSIGALRRAAPHAAGRQGLA